MKPIIGLNAVFLEGYDVGKRKRRGAFLSMAQAIKMRPNYDSEAIHVWLNGYEDGLSRDPWRATQIALSEKNDWRIFYRLFDPLHGAPEAKGGE